VRAGRLRFTADAAEFIELTDLLLAITSRDVGVAGKQVAGQHFGMRNCLPFIESNAAG
jgi:hypothetical protein